MYVPHFFVKQHLTMAVARYEITGPETEGSPGRLLAIAQHKRSGVREQVDFYSDETCTQQLFTFRAQQISDLRGHYDVADADGNLLGHFHKDFDSSLLRSTFRLSGPGFEAAGQERSLAVALLRRIVEFPFAFHFDFTGPDRGSADELRTGSLAARPLSSDGPR